MTTQILAKFENSLWTFDAFDTAQVMAMHPSGCLVLCPVPDPACSTNCLLWFVTVVVVVVSYVSLAHKMFRIVR